MPAAALVVAACGFRQRALAVRTAAPDDELLAAELARLERKLEAVEAGRRRLLDLYQAGLVELPELQRRATEVSSAAATTWTTAVAPSPRNARS